MTIKHVWVMTCDSVLHRFQSQAYENRETVEMFSFDWTTVNSQLDPAAEPDMHLCPICSAERLFIGLGRLLAVFGWNGSPVEFIWDIYPDGFDHIEYSALRQRVELTY